jgi:aromatic-amino-acid transaminase
VTPTITPGRMSSLIPEASDRPGDDPIFTLNADAQRRAQAGEAVINATLGALMEDDGRLAVMPAVFEAISSIPPEQASAYAPIAGDDAFLKAVIRDTLGSGVLAENAVAVATAGGTGAVHHSIVNFLEPGQALLTASYFWGPYQTLATHTRRAVETFEMFDADGRFHVAAFEQGLRSVITRQGRALVVFNFPCNNPTGYTLDAGEWHAVAEILKREGQTAPVTFMLDLAYARYGAEGADAWLTELESVNEVCTLLFAWSASKAFAQYGSRVGCLIAVTPDDGDRTRIANALSFSCRGTWSNCNHLGILAITKLLADDQLKARADAERGRLTALIGERVEVFNREAEKVGLRTPRYEGGFFVAVFTKDAEATAAAAREQGVFVVPMNGAVRVALCSTPARDIPRLVEVLGSV